MTETLPARGGPGLQIPDDVNRQPHAPTPRVSASPAIKPPVRVFRFLSTLVLTLACVPLAARLEPRDLAMMLAALSVMYLAAPLAKPLELPKWLQSQVGPIIVCAVLLVASFTLAVVLRVEWAAAQKVFLVFAFFAAFFFRLLGLGVEYFSPRTPPQSRRWEDWLPEFERGLGAGGPASRQPERSLERPA